MERDKNIGPYLAERIAFFKHFTYKTRVSKDIPDALSDGRVVVSGLEFKIQTNNLDFMIHISPINKNDWSKFEKHVERIKTNNFWKFDSYLTQLKNFIDESKSFVIKREDKIKSKEELLIKGTFLNYNKNFSYNYIISTIVKPLILYENFV